MTDYHKTKAQLIKELENLRRQVAELEKLETKRKRAEEALIQNEERYRTILENTQEGYFEVDLAGNFTFVNDAECNDLGYTREELIGMNYKQYTDEATAKKEYKLFNRVFRTGEYLRGFEGKFIKKDGTKGFNQVSISLIRNKEGIPVGFRGLSRDITERKEAEEALKTLILKDDLTGLFNRRGFFTLAEQGLKTAQRMGTEMMLIFGDLDNLKGINDTFGHKQGDQALVDTSQILKETFRESDIIARIGGDEFVILAMNSVETSAERLINRFEQVLNDHPLQTKRPYTLSLSLGLVCFDPQNPCSIDALIAQADKIMYENKQKRVDRFKISSPTSLMHISNSNR